MKSTAACALAILSTMIGPVAAQDLTETGVVRIEHISDSHCVSPCSRIAIIFIHGITGNQDTWLNEDTSARWPDLIANDPKFERQIDVFSIDYDSDGFSGPSFVTILKELDQQLDDLLVSKNYEKAIFVAHSLGGNLARAYLHHLKNRYGHEAMSTFRMIFTLGTPNMGSSLANIAKWLSGNEQVRVLTTLSENDFQQHLNVSTNEILAKHEDYCPDLSFFSAYELNPTPPVGVIVTQESATTFSDNSAVKGFRLNHSELAKPRGRDDPLYQWVAGGISSCLNGEDLCGGTFQDGCDRPRPDGPNPMLGLSN